VQAVSVSPVTAAARKAHDCRPRSTRAEAVIWMAVMAALVTVTIAGGGAGPALALDVPVGVVSVGLLPLLRRWPTQATVLLSLLCAVSPAATPPATMAILVVAEARPFAVSVPVAGTGIAAHLVRETWRPVAGLPYVWWTVLAFVAYAAFLGWGTLMRSHRAVISALRERAERAEADQARRAAEARAAERARIAREMHDVLAHRLSLLATYAGALAFRPDAPPEQLSRAAEVIRSGVHQSLDELREVIGVLRDDSLPDLAADRIPLPGIADLPALVEESRAAGTRVDVGGPAWPAGGPAAVPAPGPTLRPASGPVAEPDAGVPDAAGRTVYRIVQEGLTNARKHAPGEPVTVTLHGAPGAGLEVSVVNPLGPGSAPASVPGSGTGLVGLTERLELAGGRLEFGTDRGEFRLRAWLPWLNAADEEPTGADVTGVE
jgi:signal transduction histidine kinase